jgi:hypothetical protein
MFGYEESGEEFFRDLVKIKPDQNYIKKYNRAEISKEFNQIIIKSI